MKPYCGASSLSIKIQFAVFPHTQLSQWVCSKRQISDAARKTYFLLNYIGIEILLYSIKIIKINNKEFLIEYI